MENRYLAINKARHEDLNQAWQELVPRHQQIIANREHHVLVLEIKE